MLNLGDTYQSSSVGESDEGRVAGTNLSELRYLSKRFQKSIIPRSSESLLFPKGLSFVMSDL